MTRLLNVARPFTAAALAVLEPPANVPELRVSVTVDVLPVTVLPNASRTPTVTAGVIVAPVVALVGCWRKASFAAAPGLTVNELDVALVSVPSLAVKV